MEDIFRIVYKFLKWGSQLTGLTYREINIIVYFIVIPGIFIYLIGKIFKSKIPIIAFSILAAILVICIPDFESFSKTVFDKSVLFLNWFENFGLNYMEASVVICVILPILIIIGLIFLKKKNLVKN